MGVYIRTDRRLPAAVREQARRVARWLRTHHRPAHDIHILLVEPASFKIDERRTGVFGCFSWPDDPPSKVRRLEIIVAGGMAAFLVAECDLEPHIAEYAFIETIMHEYAHYEEWRDGKQPSERRVDRRSIKLARAFLTACPTTEATGARG